MPEGVTTGDRVVLHEAWKRVLLDEFDKTYMRSLRAFLLNEREAHKTIYPRGSEIFAALDLTPIDDVRVYSYVLTATDVRNGLAGRASGKITSDGQDLTVTVFLFNATGTVSGTVLDRHRKALIAHRTLALAADDGQLPNGCRTPAGKFTKYVLHLGHEHFGIMKVAEQVLQL